MACFSQTFGAAFGDPEEHIRYAILEPASTDDKGRERQPGSRLLRFMASAGIGNTYFQIYQNARLAGLVYAPEDTEVSWRVQPGYAQTSFSITPLHCGDYGDMTLDLHSVAAGFETTNARRYTVTVPFNVQIMTPMILSDGSADTYLSNWTLTGLVRGVNCETQTLPTRARLAVGVNESGGNVTVSVYNGKLLVCEGVAAAGATITLAEKNSSGVSGTVDCAGGTVDENGYLYLRWPAQMQVLLDTANPPVTVAATLGYTGSNSVIWSDNSDRAANTYYVRTRPISDTGDTGTASAVVTPDTIVSLPAAPSQLQYVSGAAAATIVQFRAPAAGVHRAYQQMVGGGPPDWNAPNANTTVVADTAWAATTAYVIGNYVASTVFNGLRYRCTRNGTSGNAEPTWSTTIGGTNDEGAGKPAWVAEGFQLTLAAFTGAPGTGRVWIRPYNGSIENPAYAGMELEYDSGGVYISARPNQPHIEVGSIAVTSGLTLALRGVYFPQDEAATATTLRLYSRSPGGASAQVASATLAAVYGSSGVQVKSAAFSYAYGAPGFYWIKVYAATAGGVLSATATPEMLIYVSDVDLPAPTGTAAEVSRG